MKRSPTNSVKVFLPGLAPWDFSVSLGLSLTCNCQTVGKFYGKLLAKGLAIATLKPTFTFLVGILSSKSIEYGKIPTKKSESWF